MLLDDKDNFSDISGRGGDDSDKDKTYVLRKGLFGLSSSSEEDNLIEGKKLEKVLRNIFHFRKFLLRVRFS